MPHLSGSLTNSITLTTNRARLITIYAGAFIVAVTDDELASLTDQIQVQRNSGNWASYAVTEDGQALLLRTKFLLALAAVNVHQLIFKQGLDSLSALAGGSTQAVTNARVNRLKAAWNTHLSNVASFTADGQHKATDVAQVVATADATNLATCIALINALLAAIIAHGNQAGVHFSDDTGIGGTTAAITTDPPTTLPHCVTDANDLLTAMTTHMGLGIT